MNPQFTTGIFNQKRWPRAGDTDDCAVLADLMAVHSVAPWLRLPGVTKYREAADRPDKPGPTPINVADSALAIRTLYPKLGALIEVMQGGTFAEFLPKLKAGHPASVSVSSGSLPAHLQFGFTADEGHRVTVFWNGSEIRLANPLARAHSRTKPISPEALQKAILAHDLPGVNAVLMPTVEEAFGLHPLLSGVIDDVIADLDDGTDDTDATEDSAAT